MQKKMCCKFESYLYILNSFFFDAAMPTIMVYDIKKLNQIILNFFCGIYIIDLVN